MVGWVWPISSTYSDEDKPMANLIRLQNILKSLSDTQLGKEMKQPSGQAPSFLVLSELHRRKDLRQRYGEGDKPPRSTVVDDVMPGGAPPQGPQPSNPIANSNLNKGFAHGGGVRKREVIPMPEGFRPGVDPEHIFFRPTEGGTHPGAGGTSQGTNPGGKGGSGSSLNLDNLTRGNRGAFQDELAGAFGGMFSPAAGMLLRGSGLHNTLAEKIIGSMLEKRGLAHGGGIRGFQEGGGIDPSISPYPIKRAGIVAAMQKAQREKEEAEARRRAGLPTMKSLPGSKGIIGALMDPQVEARADQAGFVPTPQIYNPEGPVFPTSIGQGQEDVGPMGDGGRGFISPFPYGNAPKEKGKVSSSAAPSSGLTDLSPAERGPSFDEEFRKSLATLRGEQGAPFADIQAQLDKLRGRTGDRRETAKNMALLEAGLGIAGGKSPYFATNVGEGGLKGLEAYRKSTKDIRQDQLKFLGVDATIASAKARLASQQQNIAAQLTSGKINQEQAYQKNLVAREELKNSAMRAQAQQTRANRPSALMEAVNTVMKMPEKEQEKARQILRDIRGGSSSREMLSNMRAARSGYEVIRKRLAESPRFNGLEFFDQTKPGEREKYMRLKRELKKEALREFSETPGNEDLIPYLAAGQVWERLRADEGGAGPGQRKPIAGFGS